MSAPLLSQAIVIRHDVADEQYNASALDFPLWQLCILSVCTAPYASEWVRYGGACGVWYEPGPEY